MQILYLHTSKQVFTNLTTVVLISLFLSLLKGQCVHRAQATNWD